MSLPFCLAHLVIRGIAKLYLLELDRQLFCLTFWVRGAYSFRLNLIVRALRPATAPVGAAANDTRCSVSITLEERQEIVPKYSCDTSEAPNYLSGVPIKVHNIDGTGTIATHGARRSYKPSKVVV